MLLYEEEMRLQKIVRTEQQARERRVQQLKELETTVRDSLVNQEKLREDEFSTFEKEIEQRKKLDDIAM